mmetsp:Transcript_3973/g.6708  ORF Transcript_3973/g.6708 Transcript_3973/m.6708 type:complete len:86 (-) Transcript_3973:80-337(-)
MFHKLLCSAGDCVLRNETQQLTLAFAVCFGWATGRSGGACCCRTKWRDSGRLRADKVIIDAACAQNGDAFDFVIQTISDDFQFVF